MKRTRWFPVAINPARPGWYEALYEDETESWMRRWFDGKVWRYTPQGERCGFGNTAFDDKWRGLTKEPA